jgi:hypothetical protein
MQMRTHLFVFIGATLLTATIARSSIAMAAYVSTDGSACTGRAASSMTCPFISMQPGFVGADVNTVYVDANVASTQSLKAYTCDIPYYYTGAACSTSVSTTGLNGPTEISVTGFKNIPNANKDPTDYYYTYVYTNTSTIWLYGVGYEL